MIVVDNSILVPAFVDAPNTAAAKTVITTEREWILPPLWQFEFTNALSTLVKARILEVRDARNALNEARDAVANREVPVDQRVALQMAISLNLSGYDAQYVALADEYGTRCVTADVQLATRAPDFAMLLKDFVA